MPFNLGFGEILVILVVALLVFGGRLPEVGRSVGRGLREFKEGLRDTTPLDDDEEEDAAEPEDVEPQEGPTEEEEAPRG